MSTENSEFAVPEVVADEKEEVTKESKGTKRPAEEKLTETKKAKKEDGENGAVGEYAEDEDEGEEEDDVEEDEEYDIPYGDEDADEEEDDEVEGEEEVDDEDDA